MKDRLINSEIESICEEYPPNTYRYLREQVAFAGMALCGMKRHPGGTPDWYAHNDMWANTCNRIGQITQPTPSGMGIGDKAKRLIEKIKSAAD